MAGLIESILSGAETVTAPNDDLFDQAVTLSSNDFDVVFESKVRSHEGFSGVAPKASLPLPTEKK